MTLEGKAHVERYTQALAHEFKAPLTAIRGAAELLAEDLPPAERERFVGNLRAESDRLGVTNASAGDGDITVPLRRWCGRLSGSVS